MHFNINMTENFFNNPVDYFESALKDCKNIASYTHKGNCYWICADINHKELQQYFIDYFDNIFEVRGDCLKLRKSQKEKTKDWYISIDIFFCEDLFKDQDSNIVIDFSYPE